MEKSLAYWIYWEDGEFYCENCIDDRVAEINQNKEFSEYIYYDLGQKCGYFEDYAQSEYEEECCKCAAPLLTEIIKN